MSDSPVPELLGAIEHTVSTDFALLNLFQEGGGGEAEASAYATSVPGEIALVCGTKYARTTVRVERWDSEPPPLSDPWEDEDEIPFREREDKGPLVVMGFDPPKPDEPRLDIAGLGRARVQILARGRHVASYGGGPVDQPEEWLIRIWPDRDNRDALWGSPRRIGTGPVQEGTITDDWAFPSETEVSHILRWSPPGDRQPSVREIAGRLTMARSDVRNGLGTVARLVVDRQGTSPFPDGLPSDEDTPIRFVRPPGFGFKYDANPELP